MKNNRIVVDLNKVQYAWTGWCTADGNYRRQSKPTQPTVHGHEFECEAPAIVVYPGFVGAGSQLREETTMLERAFYLGIIDEWIPYTTLQVQANHRLTYTGEKAQSIWKAWCEKQFNKSQKEKGNK
jgi:hypothetical protein